MPELPDIELYRVRLVERLVGSTVESLTFFNPFVLRTFSPPPSAFVGQSVVEVERLGKRLVIVLQGERSIVIHLMIAGRLQWQSPAPPSKKATGKIQLAALRFSSGQLTLSEMSSKKRASIMLISGRAALMEQDRGGLNVLRASFEEFSARLLSENRTLKRALTSPQLFDGIGNAIPTRFCSTRNSRRYGLRIISPSPRSPDSTRRSVQPSPTGSPTSKPRSPTFLSRTR